MARRIEFSEDGHEFLIITEEANLAHPEGTVSVLFRKTKPKFEEIARSDPHRPNESDEEVIGRLKATARAYAQLAPTKRES